MSSQKSELTRERTRSAWIFLAPTLIVLALVAGWPLGRTIWFSFTDASLESMSDGSYSMVGLANYFGDFGVFNFNSVEGFWKTDWGFAISNTFKFAIVTVVLETILGVVFALVLNAEFKGRAIVRAAVLVPWAIPTIVSAKMWAWIMHDQFGVMNAMLRSAGVIDHNIAWTADPHYALWSVVLVEAERQVAQARQVGFDQLRSEQHLHLAKFWQDADVEIEGDAALQQGIRFNLLQLLQSVGRDGRTNIAAKGVTGSGYDGHYFWDTEIYVFPVMLYTRPDIARKLLEFRYNTLDAARARARELAHDKGALFPWRTIAGEECSSYFPAGTAQFHINADIAYAVKRYWEATGDDEFIAHHGAELVFETARLWLGQGHFESGNFANGATRRFCIHTVTGPDEYTALVNNNLYTNAMAQMHLRLATHIAQWLQANRPQALQQVVSKIGLTQQEQSQWLEAAEAMYIPFDAKLGLHPQDDSFLSKPRWEAADVDPAKSPLLLHYHSLVIYRHQICKQADVVLALLLLGEQFDLESKRRDFDYYEPLTTHDSSLSRCIFGIVASEVGYHDKAYSYFLEGARTDLDDHHHNTANGVHTAAMAGSWLGVVAGFAGLRQSSAQPSFSPTLPAGWTRYAFKLRLQQAQLQVVVERGTCTYRLLQGSSVNFVHQGQAVQLSIAQPEMRLSLASS